LPPREHAFVAEIVAAHFDETRTVAAYRFTRERLPEAFAVALDVPPELIRRCLPDPGRTLKASRPRRLARLASNWRAAGLPLVASIALLLSGASGWLLRDAWQPDFAGLDKGLAAPPSLQRALERTPIGATVQLARDVSLSPMLTFLSHEGAWCRQYRLVYGAE